MATTWARHSTVAALGLVTTLVGPWFTTAQSQPGTVEVARTVYRGWTGCVRLRNDVSELIIVPAIGRIMRFAPRHGPNMLWENPELWGQLAPHPKDRRDWLNFGGDKLWPAPQERWGWPPDPWLDGSPWQVSVYRAGTVVMESPVSTRTGLRFRRTVMLHPARGEVRIRNVLENRGKDAVEWAIWEVAQVDDPERVIMPASVRGGFDSGFRVFPDMPSGPGTNVSVHDGKIHARRDPRASYKIGSASERSSIWCEKNGWVFGLHGPNRTVDTYPDGGCNVEIYSNPDPLPYMEMEVLGPMVRLKPGQATGMAVTWTLAHSKDGRKDDIP